MAFVIDHSICNVLLGAGKHGSDSILKTVLLFLQGEILVVLIEAILVDVDLLIDTKIFKGHFRETSTEDGNDWITED